MENNGIFVKGLYDLNEYLFVELYNIFKGRDDGSFFPKSFRITLTTPNYIVREIVCNFDRKLKSYKFIENKIINTDNIDLSILTLNFTRIKGYKKILMYLKVTENPLRLKIVDNNGYGFFYKEIKTNVLISIIRKDKVNTFLTE